jgi:hypothetical protein
MQVAVVAGDEPPVLLKTISWVCRSQPLTATSQNPFLLVIVHMSHLPGHGVRPIVCSVGHATEKVRWHRSYDDTNNRTDRRPYSEKVVNVIIHASQGEPEEETD